MDGNNWRHGVAGLAAGVLTAIFLALLMLALSEPIDSATKVIRHWGEFPLLIVAVISAVITIVGPGILWYGLMKAILRLLGERD